MNTFNAFPEKTRGSSSAHRNLIPVFRGSAVVDRHDFGFGPAPTDLIEKDAFIDTHSEERPPVMPYSWEVCSANTFTCTDAKVSSRALQEKVKEIIRKSPADVSDLSDWEFSGVFYPQELRTVFKVSIFENSAGHKDSCLVEMQLQEGDRVAFQGLCSYVKSQAQLVHAFAEEWGFDDEDEDELDDEWDTGYTHRSFAPLPLPSSLLSKLETVDFANEEFGPFDDSKNCLVDAFLENTCSSFLDVRRTGWQDLAKETTETEVVEALLEARVNGQECISLAADVLQQDAKCDLTADTQRCVLKTLLNIAETGDFEACRKISSLKSQIIEIAGDTKHHQTETRAIAVRLMQCLVQHNKSVDMDFVSAIRVRSKDKCRVSDDALHALSSLKLIST